MNYIVVDRHGGHKAKICGGSEKEKEGDNYPQYEGKEGVTVKRVIKS